MHNPKKYRTFALAKEIALYAKYSVGAIAQLVEQRTENPCVPGSIPGGTTQKDAIIIWLHLFFCVLAPNIAHK